MVDHDKILGLYPQLTAYACALCGNRSGADDLVQEAIARALAVESAPHSLNGLRHWMFRVIRNLYIDGQRRKKVRAEYSDSCERLHDEGQISEEHRLEIILVHQALETLTPNHREVLYLIDVLGMSYSEAADVMEVAKGTVMSRLSRARRSVLERLDGSSEKLANKTRVRKRQ